MKNYQAIYQILSDEKWLDYARDSVDVPDDAIPTVRMLARSTGKRARVSVEDWGDFPRDATIYYGEWDKSQLSPAAQETGVFKPVIY
jgi:hypothetical protein